MKQPIINIDSKPDWETYYDPKLVGEYLNSFGYGLGFKKGEIIELKPGMMIPPLPSPDLQDFLRWVATPKDKQRSE